MMLEDARSVVLSPVPLWLVFLLPLLGGIAAAFGKSAPRAISARLIAPLVVTIALLLYLAFMAGDRTLLTPLFRLFRVGALDLHLMLALDRVDGLLAAGLSSSALLLHLRQAESSATEGVSDLSIGLATAAGVVALLASNAAGTLIAFGMILVAVLASRASPGFVRVMLEGHARAIPLFLGAFIVLFWCLGGRFLDERLFFSDFGARFSTLGKAAESAPIRGDERGSLTITTQPGAKIYLGITNESQVSPVPFGVSPMVRAELPAGLHKVAIAPGDAAIVGGEGLEIALVDAVRIPSGGNTTIGLVGSSTDYDEIERQIVPGSDALADKLVGPVRARSLIAALLAAGVVVLSLFLRHLPSSASIGAAWLATVPLVIVGDFLREVRHVFDGARLAPSIAAVTLVAFLVWSAKAREGRASGNITGAMGFATLALLIATGGSAYAGAVSVCGAFGALVSRSSGDGLPHTLSLAARGGLGVFGMTSGLAVAAAYGIFGSNGAWGLLATLAALALSFVVAHALRGETSPETTSSSAAGNLPTKKSKSASPLPAERTAPSLPMLVSAALAILLVPVYVFFVRDALSPLGPLAIVGPLMSLGAALLSARIGWKRAATIEIAPADTPSFIDLLGRLGNTLHALCGGSLGGVKK